MTVEAILGLGAAAFVFALIPGPGVTALVAQSLSRGFSHGLRFGVGLVMGDMVYLLTALFGMGWVASQLGGYFALLKWIGAAYLAWLGAKSLRAAFSNKMPQPAATNTDKKTRFRGSTLLAGTCVTLGNPKVIAFYCGFLPGFVDMAKLTPLDMAEVVCTIVPVVLSVVTIYAWLAARGREAAQSTRLWKWANGTAGCVMIGAGVAVVAD
ncbi:MAG: LysE family translocator [Desulfovibrio sp.]|uniref:LysE family translocator n=1 Tax=Desulfovibrio sp. 7SRBS1 TaxID=3378064 RepID=UPI003B3D7E64